MIIYILWSTQHPTGDESGHHQPLPPAYACRELRPPATTGYRYRNIQNRTASLADFDLTALSLSELKKM
jgi:hypothetical protein